MTPGRMLVDGELGLVVVLLVAALLQGRTRSAGWPLWRCGPAVLALAAYDVATGSVTFLLLVGGTAKLAEVAGWDGELAALATGLAAAIALIVSLARLWFDGGTGVTGLWPRRRRSRGAVFEPCPTVRGRLLAAIELAAVRGCSRWIADGLHRCRRRAHATPEQLLPALWPQARLQLRETVGIGRTGLALLLLQAQAVAEDAAPPHERTLALLHLVYQRCGPVGVRRVLRQTAEAPLRLSVPA